MLMDSARTTRRRSYLGSPSVTIHTSMCSTAQCDLQGLMVPVTIVAVITLRLVSAGAGTTNYELDETARQLDPRGTRRCD